jgi:hypothetical protein
MLNTNILYRSITTSIIISFLLFVNLFSAEYIHTFYKTSTHDKCLTLMLTCALLSFPIFLNCVLCDGVYINPIFPCLIPMIFIHTLELSMML